MDDNYPTTFRKQFTLQNSSYLAHVISFEAAGEVDKTNYAMSEGEFLVHVFCNDRCLSFKVFYDDKLEWNTTASKIIIDDRELIEKIGFLIDDAYA